MSASPGATSPRPRKTRRNPRACDVCSRRSVRCQPSGEEPGRCQNCVDYGETCTFNRPLRKRGAKPKKHRPVDEEISLESSGNNVHGQSTTTCATPSGYSPGVVPSSHAGSEADWRPSLSATQALVMDLTEVYFEVVYPLFPFFHRPTLIRRVSRGEHLTNRSFFAALMALCALSSARARDGALYSPKWNAHTLQEPPSEALFQAAEDAIPKQATLTQDFDYMRASIILAITAIQYGKAPLMNHYLGLYHEFVAVGRLHDESSWPREIGIVEVEERRRLFWSAYSLDVFASVVWGGIVRSREASSLVRYPTELDDDTFSNAGYPDKAGDEGNAGWLRGWNFVTDLYRILEHSVGHTRHPHTSSQRSSFAQTLVEGSLTPQAAILHQVLAMYSGLPPVFKITRQMTCNLSEDLFSFQAANIAATVQLLRMVHFASDQCTLEEKCQVAGEVIAGFASVPVGYLRAISSPLFYHLASIGTFLAAAVEKAITESSYHRVRCLLLDLANFLGRLENNLYCPSGMSDKLRAQVTKIDHYMGSQRITTSVPPVTHHHGAGGTIVPLQRLATVPIIGGENEGRVLPIQRQTLANVAHMATHSPQYRFHPELVEDWSWVFDPANTSA